MRPCVTRCGSRSTDLFAIDEARGPAPDRSKAAARLSRPAVRQHAPTLEAVRQHAPTLEQDTCMSSGDDNGNPGPVGRSAYWLSWMLGAAILVAVVLAALHVAEGRELIDVAGRAKPWWLVLAVCLQGATYLAQAEIFRRVPRAAGYDLPLTAAYELSLAKLFIDQALPSAGIGSTIVVAKALERRAVPRAVVAASMVINIASYHAAYVVCLSLALALTTSRGETHVPVVVVSVLFIAFSVAVTTGLLLLSGRDVDRIAVKLQRLPALKNERDETKRDGTYRRCPGAVGKPRPES